jgi:hypothetical protein
MTGVTEEEPATHDLPSTVLPANAGFSADGT